MSGVSASTLVLFIASVVVAAGVAGTLVTTVGDITKSAETRGDAISESIDTDIEILNDGGGSEFYKESGVDGGAAEITLYARNTGSTNAEQDPNAISVLVNGRLVAAGNLTITSTEGGSETVWERDEVIEIVVVLEGTLDGSGNRVTVSIEGAEESVEFEAND